MDVLELFAGGASLTKACLAGGMKVASALDILYQSYGRTWDFSRPDHQADVAYLIVFVFRPKVIPVYGLLCVGQEPAERGERSVPGPLSHLHEASGRG